MRALPLRSILMTVATLGCTTLAGADTSADLGSPVAVFSDGFEFGDLVGWNYEPAALAGTLAAHNAVREGVGVGMAPLIWDGHLAATAQAWAEGCVDLLPPIGFIDHNPDRSEGYPWYVGENIAASGGTLSGPAAVSMWAAEAAFYDYPTNTCDVGHICAHYTQLVWAATERVGCGTALCPALTFSRGVVCNYGPGGNVGGWPY